MSVSSHHLVFGIDATSCAMLSGWFRAVCSRGSSCRRGPSSSALFAALDVLEGKVIGRCMQRHRHQEFIRFLNAIEAQVPARKLVHVILDNYAAHKHNLKQVTELALAGNQFGAIARKLREANFRDTTLPLTGWKDCALYGATTYTCDSQALRTSHEAEEGLTNTTDDILRCLAGVVGGNQGPFFRRLCRSSSDTRKHFHHPQPRTLSP
jgi:hypothetical protein